MRDACEGQTGAFGALVARHQGRVFALLHFLVRDVAERDDVAQETFLAAWRALPSFDPQRGSFGPWLLAIARNRALNALRRPRVASLGDAEPWTGAPAPLEPDLARRLDSPCARSRWTNDSSTCWSTSKGSRWRKLLCSRTYRWAR